MQRDLTVVCSTSFQEMAWSGSKHLPEPMLTKSYDAIWRH